MVCDGSSPVSLTKRSQIGLFFVVVVAGVRYYGLYYYYSTFSKCGAANRVESHSLCPHYFLRFYGRSSFFHRLSFLRHPRIFSLVRTFLSNVAGPLYLSRGESYARSLSRSKYGIELVPCRSSYVPKPLSTSFSSSAGFSNRYFIGSILANRRTE